MQRNQRFRNPFGMIEISWGCDLAKPCLNPKPYNIASHTRKKNNKYGRDQIPICKRVRGIPGNGPGFPGCAFASHSGGTYSAGAPAAAAAAPPCPEAPVAGADPVAPVAVQTLLLLLPVQILLLLLPVQVLLLVVLLLLPWRLEGLQAQEVDELLGCERMRRQHGSNYCRPRGFRTQPAGWVLFSFDPRGMEPLRQCPMDIGFFFFLLLGKLGFQRRSCSRGLFVFCQLGLSSKTTFSSLRPWATRVAKWRM